MIVAAHRIVLYSAAGGLKLVARASFDCCSKAYLNDIDASGPHTNAETSSGIVYLNAVVAEQEDLPLFSAQASQVNDIKVVFRLLSPANLIDVQLCGPRTNAETLTP
jgi:hypothetical protein